MASLETRTSIVVVFFGSRSEWDDWVIAAQRLWVMCEPNPTLFVPVRKQIHAGTRQPTAGTYEQVAHWTNQVWARSAELASALASVRLDRTRAIAPISNC